MRVSQTKNAVVFVASGIDDKNKENCPRLKLTQNKLLVRDDYKGSMKLAKSLFRNLVNL